LVVFAAHLAAAAVPGRGQLPQARHLVAAAAAAAGAVVAEAADPEHPAFCLVERALHPPVLHRPEARPADAIRQAAPREVGRAQLRP
jgi:hypothetical protein